MPVPEHSADPPAVSRPAAVEAATGVGPSTARKPHAARPATDPPPPRAVTAGACGVEPGSTRPPVAAANRTMAAPARPGPQGLGEPAGSRSLPLVRSLQAPHVGRGGRSAGDCWLSPARVRAGGRHRPRPTTRHRPPRSAKNPVAGPGPKSHGGAHPLVSSLSALAAAPADMLDTGAHTCGSGPPAPSRKDGEEGMKKGRRLSGRHGPRQHRGRQHADADESERRKANSATATATGPCTAGVCLAGHTGGGPTARQPARQATTVSAGNMSGRSRTNHPSWGEAKPRAGSAQPKPRFPVTTARWTPGSNHQTRWPRSQTVRWLGRHVPVRRVGCLETPGFPAWWPNAPPDDQHR